MFPIGDDNSGRHGTPVVTYGLIALNLLMFFLQMQGGDRFTVDWAFVPARFNEAPVADWPTLFSAMFMHGGVMHLFGNMLYLWIFGDNVEDRFGSARFLIFYLVSGLAGTFAQFMLNPGSSIPNVGASGAISGILGAYIYLFPHQKVRVLVINQIIVLPAIFVIGIWIALQLFSGFGSMAAAGRGPETGGVAYLAHIGGFVAGLALAVMLKGTFTGGRRGGDVA